MGLDTEVPGTDPMCDAGGLISQRLVSCVSPRRSTGRGVTDILGNETLQTGGLDTNYNEYGIVLPKMLPDPGIPSSQEILEQELTSSVSCLVSPLHGRTGQGRKACV